MPERTDDGILLLQYMCQALAQSLIRSNDAEDARSLADCANALADRLEQGSELQPEQVPSSTPTAIEQIVVDHAGPSSMLDGGAAP